MTDSNLITLCAECHEKGYCGRSDEASEVPDLHSEENRFHWVASRQQKGIPIESRGTEQASLRHCLHLPLRLDRHHGNSTAGILWESSVKPASEFRVMFD